ncbi:hypothetical protein HDU81_002658 [Chytriomyces hyalinus]|nr:hypothetical protein HDU81_002658 [Chytriomyces hyalinus]
MAPQGSRYEVTGDSVVVDAVLPSGGSPNEGLNGEESKLQSTTATEIITEVGATTTISAASFAIASTTVSSSTSSKISSTTTTVSSTGFIPNENSFASNNAINTADPIAQQPAAYATSAMADPALLSANPAVNPLMMIIGGLGLLAAVWLTIFCCVCFQRKRSASRFEQEENDKDNWVPPATYSKDVAAAGADMSKFNESDYYNSYSLPAGEDYLQPPVNSRAPSVYSQHPSVYSMHNDAYTHPDYNMYALDNADVATVRNMEKYKSSAADTVKMQRHKSSASSVYPNSMFFAQDEDEYGAQVEYEYNVFAKDMSKRKSIADEWRSEIEQAIADTSSNGSGGGRC